MLSNKLTFSLASLIVLLIAAVCLPVAAQTVVVPDGTVPANGHLVIARAADTTTGIDAAITPVAVTSTPALPDLANFFSAGGTVELIISSQVAADSAIDLDPGTGDDEVRNPAAKDLVISEIMWGRDESGANAAGRIAKQWIEIYNTTEFAINIAGTANATATVAASLVFTPFTTVTDAPGDNLLLSDTVSNVHLGKWTVPGQSGVSVLGTQVNAPLQSNLVSAYRNIDYAKVMGIHKINELTHVVDDEANRAEQLKGVPDGRLSNSWKATPVAGSRNMERWHIGSAGVRHVPDKEFTFEIAVTSIPSNSVVINEVHDNPNNDLDWVELYNAGTEAVGLRDWELTLITGDDAAKTDGFLVGREEEHRTTEDQNKYSFPKNEDFKLQPGAYLLIVNRDPRETPLANGVNVEEAIAGREIKAGAMHQYIIREKLELPNAAFTLILRNAVDKNTRHKDPFKDDHAMNRATVDVAPSEKIMDFAGTHRIAVGTSEYNTVFWPFRGWDGLGAATGKDGEAIPNDAAKSHARKRYQANDGHHKDAWDQVGHKGGIGYDPGADLTISPGTPGYPNTALLSQLVDDKNNADATDDVIYSGEISISEVMYDAGPRWNLIQWIELYNSSMTEAINVAGWELEIRNATDEVESYVDSGFVFNDAYILPNQTLLIVSGTGTNDVADNRVYNLYQHHRRELGLTNRRSVLLSPGGFYLKLTDKNDEMVDEAGNVMVDGATRTVMWELPARDANMRQSLVRQYGTRELYDGTPDMADDGTMMESWRQSDLVGAGISFYGHRDDISTPGYRLGGPLPVSLSKFRPVRNQDTGHVDITWITESELNNAGFNILRSEAKNGEFKVVNVKGIIAGHGTTSEQHVYKFTDTNTKPNVVYYYQIEDVSINGMRTTLTTTHLRGHVGAAGKLTTTWGDLKLQK